MWRLMLFGFLALWLAGCAGGTTAPTLPLPAISAVTPSGATAAGVTGAVVEFGATVAGTILAWQWEFGGGTEPDTSTAARPRVTLGAPGSYTGVVRATNAAGESPRFEFTYTIAMGGGGSGLPPAIVQVLPATDPIGTSGASLMFSALANHAPTAWLWTFAGGITPATSTAAAPEVTLGAPGSYTGTVVASNAAGESPPFDFSYTIAPLPTVPAITAITPANMTIGTPGTAVSFHATITGEVDRWAWDFGGGGSPNTSTAAQPNVTLGAVGTYQGQLIAGNAAGDSTPFAFEYTIGDTQPPPGISLVTGTKTKVVPGESQTFRGYFFGSIPTSFEWEFLSGATPLTSSDPEPTVAVTTPGRHAGTLRVSNVHGTSAPFSFTFDVDPLPDPPLITGVFPTSDITGAPGQDILFSAAYSGGLADEWEWEFGAGATPLGNPGQFMQAELGPEGTYTGSVRARNAGGESAPFEFMYRAFHVPQLLGIIPAEPKGVQGTFLQFSANIAGVEPDTYLWKFGSGATPGISTEAAPLVRLSNSPNLYAGSLTISRQDWTSAPLAFNLHVTLPPPVINEVVPSGSAAGHEGQTVQFRTVPAISPGTVDYVAWDFGGGATPNQATTFQPSVTLGTPGLYNGLLEVHNGGGELLFPFTYVVKGSTSVPGWNLSQIATTSAKYGAAAVIDGRPAVAYNGRFATALTANPQSPADWQVHFASISNDSDVQLFVLDGRPVVFTTSYYFSTDVATTTFPTSSSDWASYTQFTRPFTSTGSADAALVGDRIVVVQTGTNTPPQKYRPYVAVAQVPAPTADAHWLYYPLIVTSQYNGYDACTITALNGLPVISWVTKASLTQRDLQTAIGTVPYPSEIGEWDIGVAMADIPVACAPLRVAACSEGETLYIGFQGVNGTGCYRTSIRIARRDPAGIWKLGTAQQGSLDADGDLKRLSLVDGRLLALTDGAGGTHLFRGHSNFFDPAPWEEVVIPLQASQVEAYGDRLITAGRPLTAPDEVRFAMSAAPW